MSTPMNRCPNCGTPNSATALACAICQLALTPMPDQQHQIGSLGELEAKLDALISSALASGIDSAGVIQALRGEIAYTAEMSQTGHRFAVQLIDLGLQEGEYAHSQRPNRPQLAQQRTGAK
jgi:hypothetical protein